MTTTLTTLRQALADRGLNAYRSGTATSGSTTALLEDVTLLKTAMPVNDMLEGWTLFTPNAVAAGDKLRTIGPYTAATLGYDAANGKLYVDKTYATAPYSAGVGLAYELHGHGFDPLNQLPAFINQALKFSYMVWEITTTPNATANAQRTSLSAFPWLTDEKQVYQMGWLASTESRELYDPFQRVVRGEVFHEDSGTLYVQHNGRSFNSTDVLYFRTKRRLYDLVKPAAGGNFGDQSGLALEGDTIPPTVPVDWVIAGALVEAWDNFPELLVGSAAAQRVGNLKTAKHMWQAETRQNFTAPIRTLTPIEPLVMTGARAALWW